MQGEMSHLASELSFSRQQEKCVPDVRDRMSGISANCVSVGGEGWKNVYFRFGNSTIGSVHYAKFMSTLVYQLEKVIMAKSTTSPLAGPP